MGSTGLDGCYSMYQDHLCFRKAIYGRGDTCGRLNSKSRNRASVNETMVETITLVGTYRAFIILGFLRCCRISSIHSIKLWVSSEPPFWLVTKGSEGGGVGVYGLPPPWGAWV